jgi:hypothetical protein
MRDIMEERQAKVSTNIRSFLRNSSNAILFFVCSVILSCDSDLSDDAIPFQPFPPMVINLTQPTYNAFNSVGWVSLDAIGMRGVIVYKVDEVTYLAYERNCSYQPNEACATVDVHSSNLYMMDACCGSTFTFADGKPSSGPAWRSLRQYVTTLNGSTLTITDEILQ